LERAETQWCANLLKSACIKSDGKTNYVLFGIENQSRPETAMVLRCLEYDLLALRDSLCELVSLRHPGAAVKGKDMLSALQLGEKVPPVITVVIYWGADKWSVPKSLHDLIDFPLPELRRFVPNYRLNLIEPCRLTARKRARFSTKLGAMLHYVKSLKSERSMKVLLKHESGLADLSQTEQGLLAALGGDKAAQIKSTYKAIGGGDMRTAWDEMVENAEKRGMKKGFSQGHRKGRAEGGRAERQATIRQLAHSLQALGVDDATGLSVMMSTFGMTPAQARKSLTES